MSPPPQRRVDGLLDEAYLDGLDAKPLDAVRTMQDECLEVETELSYVRRLAQARIDIVTADLERREAGGSVEDLVAQLPRILGDEPPRPDPAHSRLPRKLAPSVDVTGHDLEDLVADASLVSLITDSTLANLSNLSEDDLRANRERLRTLEREMSARRRALHAVLDRIEMELATRRRVDHV